MREGGSRKKRREVRRHPKYPNRDRLGRMVKGCASPNPYARSRQLAETEPQSEQPPRDNAGFDAELLRLIPRREYLRAVKAALKQGQPWAILRYEQAVDRQRPPCAESEPAWRTLSVPALALVSALLRHDPSDQPAKRALDAERARLALELAGELLGLTHSKAQLFTEEFLRALKGEQEPPEIGVQEESAALPDPPLPEPEPVPQRKVVDIDCRKNDVVPVREIGAGYHDAPWNRRWEN